MLVESVDLHHFLMEQGAKISSKRILILGELNPLVGADNQDFSQPIVMHGWIVLEQVSF